MVAGLSEFNTEKNALRAKLINLITLELLFLSMLLIYINMVLGQWRVAVVLLLGSMGMLSNLLLLKRTQKIDFCGHTITGLTFLVMMSCNYLMSGAIVSYVGWFLAMPVIAAVVLGIPALLVYTALSLIMIIGFGFMDTSSVPIIPYDTIVAMNAVNLLFPLTIVATSLFFLLQKNNYFEFIINKHNQLLRDEKEKFEHLSRYDTLTNLPNRNYFQAYLQTVLEHITVNDETITLLFMDLDALKPINDKFGHEAGDALLELGAKRLQSCLRRNDFLARLGGDEFTAVLHHKKDSRLPHTIAKRIITEFSTPFFISDKKIDCSISIGLSTYSKEHHTIDSLLKTADQALYLIKKEGGNNYKFYEV